MHKHKVFGIMMILFSIFLFVSCTSEGDQIELQFSPEAGDVIQFSMIMEQDAARIRAMGAEPKMLCLGNLGLGRLAGSPDGNLQLQTIPQPDFRSVHPGAQARFGTMSHLGQQKQA